MKVKFLIVALATLMVSSVQARVLTCDKYLPPMVPTKFQVVIDNGAPVGSLPVSAPGGGVTLGHNIDSLGNGNHTAKVSACDSSGCSVFSDVFAFRISLPPPTNIICNPVCSVVTP